MEDETRAILDEVLSQLSDIMKMKQKDFPNIDLYMDQVTAFMDEKLYSTLRENEAGKRIITKTMINNYAKNSLLPAPEKKKYTKEHMMTLIFIYYFKSFLTINDIEELLNPITEKYFGKKEGQCLGDIYDEIFESGEARLEHLKLDLEDKYEASLELFQDVDGDDGEYLRLFSFVCYLSYDIFVKKMLIERLVDESARKRQKAEEQKKEKEKEDKKKK